MRNDMRKKIENYSYGLNDHLDLDIKGNIFRGINEQNQDKVIITVVDLRNREHDFAKDILNVQTEALKKLKHPNIIQCHDIFSTVNNCYIITEFCDQGDLKNKLAYRGCFKEAEAITLFRDVINGYRYLAQQKFIHANLKPSCLLIKDNSVKISGFSNCRKLTKEIKKQAKYNSFQSPESMKDAIFNHKSDIWSLGMILYVFLHGTFPWQFTNKTELLDKINKPFTINKQISQDIRQFLKRTLTVKQNRINLEELLIHPFILRILNTNYFTPQKYGLALIANLQELKQPKIKKDSLQTNIAKVQKQLSCHFNWLRFLFRLIQRLINYPEDSTVYLLKFIIIRQLAAQYQSLKNCLSSNNNDFGFANWRQYLEEKDRVNKFKQLLKQNEVRYQKIKGGYKRLIDKLNLINTTNNTNSWAPILNDNFKLSEYNSMVAIKVSTEQIRKIWAKITKEYPTNQRYQAQTPFKYKVDLLILDFIISYYQLNSLLVDDFYRPEHFEKMSKLDVILQYPPIELDITHLKQFESKLTQLMLIP